MRFDILTIFPEMFGDYFEQSEKQSSGEKRTGSYFNASILKKAQKKKLIKIHIHNLRKWTLDRHQTTDDCPYGGGMGMIFKVEPIFKAIKDLKKKKTKKCRIILFSAKGKKLTQRRVKQLSKYDQLILICPRYEGVDERVAKYIADEEISIGEYILTGGELPAMVLVDAVSRFIPGVIKKGSLLEESFSIDFGGKGEYPQYTRPEIFYPNKKKKKIVWQVPDILLSGNHKKIKEWRRKHLKKI